MITFLLTNWKYIAIGLLLAALAYVVNDYLGQRQVIDNLEQKVGEQAVLLDDANARLTVYESAEQKAQEKQKVVVKEIQKVVVEYQDRIVEITKTEVPKECNAAITYAISSRQQFSW